jgi:hypothetical protein
VSTVYIGELSLAAAVPGPMPLLLAAQAQLQAQVTATVAMQANVQIPNTLDQLIAMAKQILANLEGMLLSGLEPPSINLQLAIIASTLAALELQLAPFLAFGAVMATGGVFAYVYDGTTAGAGAEFTTALSGGFPGHSGADHCNMVVLGCVASATWTAMQTVFKTSP